MTEDTTAFAALYGDHWGEHPAFPVAEWATAVVNKVPTSLLAHQHVIEDLGFVPTLDHYIELLRCPRWASKPARLLHSRLTQALNPEPASS